LVIFSAADAIVKFDYKQQ